jgi:hypothetical protein
MEEEVASERPERLCQAVSPNDEPCDFPATVHFAKCGSLRCARSKNTSHWKEVHDSSNGDGWRSRSASGEKGEIPCAVRSALMNFLQSA